MKLFLRANTETDYILDFIIFDGSKTKWSVFHEELGVTGSSVLSLMQGYLGKGHTLFTDNWYTSPRLAQHLQKNKTNYCGTIHSSRKEMPKFPKKKMKKGEVLAQHNDKMMVLKWNYRRIVHMLSTFHTNTMTQTSKINRETGQPISKPSCIIDYNQHMDTIDKIDMLISPVSCLQKTLKWYKQVFLALTGNYAVLNAYNMYKVFSGLNIMFAKFHLELIRQLIAKYKKTQPSSWGGRPASGDIPNRLIDRHFPSLIPSTPGHSNRQRYCHVCSHTQLRKKKRSDSRFECVECNVGLCVPDCFSVFHTKKKYW